MPRFFACLAWCCHATTTRYYLCCTQRPGSCIFRCYAVRELESAFGFARARCRLGLHTMQLLFCLDRHVTSRQLKPKPDDGHGPSFPFRDAGLGWAGLALRVSRARRHDASCLSLPLSSFDSLGPRPVILENQVLGMRIRTRSFGPSTHTPVGSHMQWPFLCFFSFLRLFGAFSLV